LNIGSKGSRKGREALKGKKSNFFWDSKNFSVNQSENLSSRVIEQSDRNIDNQ